MITVATVDWALYTRHVIHFKSFYLIFTVILWDSISITHFTYEGHIAVSVLKDLNSGHSKFNSSLSPMLLSKSD